MIGTLPLNERLFMFYKRKDRLMIPHIPAIAAYWAEDERVLEKVLKFKYASNLEEEGLGYALAVCVKALWKRIFCLCCWVHLHVQTCRSESTMHVRSVHRSMCVLGSRSQPIAF